MINAKELRIGNWVKDADGDFKVLGIEHDANKYWIGINKGTSVNAVAIEPIELTEDVLIKIGLKKIENPDKLFDIYEYDEYFFCWDGNEIHAVGVETYNGDIVPDGLINFAWHIKYLHQLQNLFFALTGEELNIELNAPVSDTTKA
jgi:hypothetical protein